MFPEIRIPAGQRYDRREFPFVYEYVFLLQKDIFINKRRQYRHVECTNGSEYVDPTLGAFELIEANGRYVEVL